MKFKQAITNFNEFINSEFSSGSQTVFLHIPKTAGTLFMQYLLEIKSNPYYITWNRIHASFKELLQRNDIDTFDMVTGHFGFEHVEKFKEVNPNIVLLTVLRHPVERLISEYRYQCTEKHPTYKEFRIKFPTFDSWLVTIQDNLQGERLVGKKNCQSDYYELLLNTYDFIASQDLFEVSMAIIHHKFNHKFKIKSKVNVTKNNTINQFKISDKTKLELASRHAIDIGVYNKFSSDFNKITNEFIKFLYLRR